MTALLDDPSPLVRRALAEALGGASEAPRHLILALAARRAGRGGRGASALACADRRRPRRLRGDRRRRRPIRAGAKAQSLAGRSRGAGRSRRTRRDSDAHRQSRSRASRQARLTAFLQRFGDDRRSARGPASASLAAGKLEGADRRGDREGLERRDGAMAAARASRACRPRGARSGDLFDRLVLQRRRADGARPRLCAHAER